MNILSGAKEACTYADGVDGDYRTTRLDIIIFTRISVVIVITESFPMQVLYCKTYFT